MNTATGHHPVKHPSHYQGDGIEAMEVVEAFGLCWHLGNAFKYLVRCHRKGNTVQDLEKAVFCIQREIELIKKGRQCHHARREPKETKSK